MTGPALAEEDHAVFWQWVCDRKAHDNPRGDFIRDTRIIRSVHDPNEAWWEVCPNYLTGASLAAYEEYQRLVRQFNRLPERPSYNSQQSTPQWTSRFDYRKACRSLGMSGLNFIKHVAALKSFGESLLTSAKCVSAL